MWFGRLGLRDTVDALIADGVLPPLAVLAPDAVGAATRRLELGGRESYVSFLADEVVPWASARWPLTGRAERTVVAGQGLGGMTALYAGLTRPERFGAVVAQSPSLWWRPGLEPGTVAPDAVGTPWLATLAAGLRDGLPSGRDGVRGASSTSTSACTRGPWPNTPRPSARCSGPGATGSPAPSTTAATTTRAGGGSWPTPW